MEPPSKRQKQLLLDDSASENEAEREDGRREIFTSTHPTDQEFKINEKYAQRYEHNKKREELQRLEEKLGKSASVGQRKRSREDAPADEQETREGKTSSSEDEDEDDAGDLATEALDSEIFATLQAIRSKDPKVYDSNAVFYIQPADMDDTQTEPPKAKPMTLRDYHRENLLGGATAQNDTNEDLPKPYFEQQEELKRSLVKQMHAAAEADVSDAEAEDSTGNSGFLVRKKNLASSADLKKKRTITELDVAEADKDPENFLSNFLASRAWVPSEKAGWQPFESDDEDEEEKAEALEEAYNLRFEDPNKINEVLVTHARDATAKFSVRREELSSRKKQREAERKKKEEAKKELEAERNLLRKLKIEQLEEKLDMIKRAGGIKTDDVPTEDWARFLEEGWDDKKWEEEMRLRFGEDYYAGKDDAGVGDEENVDATGKRKPKKPKWDDDIDIADLIPDFDTEGETFELSDENAMEEAVNDECHTPRQTKKQLLEEKKLKQREVKRERRKIELAVDQRLDLEVSLLPGTSKGTPGFRYRETSPMSLGLTARDILMAEDRQLNQFAGLKKLAPFRDPEKKRRDQKKLGKKARLRQWRKETFGDENGPSLELTEQIPVQLADAVVHNDDPVKVDVREGHKRKSRKRFKKH